MQVTEVRVLEEISEGTYKVEVRGAGGEKQRRTIFRSQLEGYKKSRLVTFIDLDRKVYAAAKKPRGSRPLQERLGSEPKKPPPEKKGFLRRILRK